MSFEIRELLVNQEKEPLGMDIVFPVFSWKLYSDEYGVKQVKYQIQVRSRSNGCLYWDTQIQHGSCSAGVRYAGEKLLPETDYSVNVRVWNQKGEEAETDSHFETGFLNGDVSAWEGAAWIGAPEYYLASDTMSVFSIESNISIHLGGKRAGIIFGANDERLLDQYKNELGLEGENQIRYVLNVSEIPAILEIYRIGYSKDDSACKPLAAVNIVSQETAEPVITEENRYKPHNLRVEVMGNSAYAYVDGILVDAVKRMTFSGERISPRQLNPLGFNDVTTYPRLCEAGYYAERGTTVRFDGLVIRNVREPRAVVARIDAETGSTISAGQEDVCKLFQLSSHSLPMLRHDFKVGEEVQSARVYATARGIYTVKINGQKLTDQYFMPGASQYDKHLMYQTYDITGLLQTGENAIGFTLASGWWSDMSTYGLYNYNYWGDRPSLLAKIVITYANGKRQVFTTNCDEWQYYGEGPCLYAGFFNGEQYDEGRRWIDEGFSMPGFKVEGMKKPEEIIPVPIWADKPSTPLIPGWEHVNITAPEIVGSYNAPVKVVESLNAKSVHEPRKGLYIYDLGQEITGIPSIHFHGEKGTRIRLRYGEMLYPDLPEYGQLAGTLLQANLREASNTDICFLSGGDNDIFQPEFTFHGFRYIEISGLEKAPALEEVKGLLLSSVDHVTGMFTCSNELVNKFVSNVKYSMLCNYLSIPTDCPQRNERMGWTGDTHVFARTASYQANIRNFLLRNMQAIRDLQRKNGHLPNIAPVGGGFGGITYESALVLLSWELYQQYGDIEILKENFDVMDKWMDTMVYEGLPGEQYQGFLGDWLAPDETDKHLVWNAFFGRDASYMRRFSEILGKKEMQKKYEKIEKRTIQYWNDTFIDLDSGITKCLDGTICDTQGSYVIGLDCGMMEGIRREQACSHLVRKIEEAGYTVRTGFFGTGALNRVLTEHGRHDVAVRLMTQTACPGWLYPVTQGATTIWERWNSYTAEEGFGCNNAMNSFNHYSLGSVLSWCYESVLGIRRDERHPGYGHFYLEPRTYGFDYASGGIDTPYGRIESSWKKEGNHVVYTCTVPANAKAQLHIQGLYIKLQSGKYYFEWSEDSEDKS